MLVLHEKSIYDFQTSVITKIEITITCNHHQNLNYQKIQPSFNPIICETSTAHTNKLGIRLPSPSQKTSHNNPNLVYSHPPSPLKNTQTTHTADNPHAAYIYVVIEKLKNKNKNCTRTLNFIQSVLILAVRLGPHKSL